MTSRYDGNNLNPNPSRIPDVDFDYSQLNTVFVRFNNPTQVANAMLLEMTRLGRRLAPRLEADTPIGATRALRDSTTMSVVLDSNSLSSLQGQTVVTLTLLQPAVAVQLSGGSVQELINTGLGFSFSTVSYRQFASLGRGPGRRFPYQRLISWVIAKRLVSYGDKASKIKSTAYLIARKISLQGGERYRTRAIPYAEVTVLRSQHMIAEAGQRTNSHIAAFITDNLTRGQRTR